VVGDVRIEERFGHERIVTAPTGAVAPIETEPALAYRPWHMSARGPRGALAAMLAASPRGLLLASDEMSSWLGGFTRYMNGSGRPASEASRPGRSRRRDGGGGPRGRPRPPTSVTCHEAPRHPGCRR
jgi:hypothetical protein